MLDRNTKIGTSVILLGTWLWSFHPILIQRVTQTAPGLVIATLTHSVALLTALVVFAWRGDFSGFKKTHLYKDQLLAAFLIVVVPMTLFYLGARLTSGVNASVLLLSELLFTVPVARFYGEKITSAKVIGTTSVLLGSFLVLFKGFNNFSWGDIVIIFSTASYPFGNIISKRLLKELSPETVLVSRLMLGVPILFVLSLIFSPGANYSETVSNYWPTLLAAGGLCLAISKLLWFNGIKRLDISQAVPIGLTFPLFSILTLTALGLETISNQQFFGIIFLLIGVYYIVSKTTKI